MPMHAVATVECPWWIIIKKRIWGDPDDCHQRAMMRCDHNDHLIQEEWSQPNWKIQWISHIKIFWLPAKKVKGVVPTFTYPRMLLRLMTILGDMVNHHWWCHSILVRMGGVEMVRQSLRFNNNSTNIYFPNLAEISDNWIPLLAASYPDELLAPLSIIRTLAIIIITITVIIITITIITIIALITIIVIYLISKITIITCQ